MTSATRGRRAATGLPAPPRDASRLGEPVGLYGVSDVFDLQDSVDGMFGNG